MSFTEWWNGLSVVNKTFGIISVAIFLIALLCLIIGLFVSNNKYKKISKIKKKENEQEKKQEQQKADGKLQEQIERLKEEIKNVRDAKQPETKPSKDYSNDLADLKIQNAKMEAKYDELLSTVRNQQQNPQIPHDPEIQDLKRQLEDTNKKLDEQQKSLSELKTNQQQQPKEQPNPDVQKQPDANKNPNEQQKDLNIKDNQQQPVQPGQQNMNGYMNGYYPPMWNYYQPLAPMNGYYQPNGYPAPYAMNPMMSPMMNPMMTPMMSPMMNPMMSPMMNPMMPPMMNPMFAGGYMPQFCPPMGGSMPVPGTWTFNPIQPVVAPAPAVLGHDREIVSPVRRVFVERPYSDFLDTPYNSTDVLDRPYPPRRRYGYDPSYDSHAPYPYNGPENRPPYNPPYPPRDNPETPRTTEIDSLKTILTDKIDNLKEENKKNIDSLKEDYDNKINDLKRTYLANRFRGPDEHVGPGTDGERVPGTFDSRRGKFGDGFRGPDEHVGPGTDGERVPGTFDSRRGKFGDGFRGRIDTEEPVGPGTDGEVKDLEKILNPDGGADEGEGEPKQPFNADLLDDVNNQFGELDTEWEKTMKTIGVGENDDENKKVTVDDVFKMITIIRQLKDLKLRLEKEAENCLHDDKGNPVFDLDGDNLNKNTYVSTLNDLNEAINEKDEMKNNFIKTLTLEERKQLIQKVGEKWGNTEEININDDEEEINNDEEEIKVPIPNEYKDDVDRINNIMQDLKKQIDERESWDTFSETISRNYQETTLLELVTQIESDNNLPEHDGFHQPVQ